MYLRPLQVRNVAYCNSMCPIGLAFGGFSHHFCLPPQFLGSHHWNHDPSSPLDWFRLPSCADFSFSIDNLKHWIES